MLTPDERYLDRRIAQEAASLAAHGWSVDIHPTVDPSLTYGGDLAPNVRLLTTPVRPAPDSTRRRALRRLRRAIAPAVPMLDRAIEAARYRATDRARRIAAANESHLLGLGRYQLVFAHDVPVFPLGVAVARAWTAPLICDLHEIFPEQDEHFTTETARSYWRRVEAEGIAAADGIICVNGAVADYVADRYAPAATTVVVHNSMPYVPPGELHGSSIRDVYPIPADRRVMLFAGSLRPYANLETIISAFGAAGLDGWALAIMGDGPLKDRLNQLVVERGLGNTVFLGYRAPESQLLKLASSADVGLLPYQAVGINHTIATPNKLFEYIQARVPIATSRLPMIERIVDGSGIGGFVDYASEQTAARDLRAFVSDVLPAITIEAREAAARRHSWEQDEPALLEVVAAATRRAR